MTSKERKVQQNAASKKYFEKYVLPLTVSAWVLSARFQRNKVVIAAKQKARKAAKRAQARYALTILYLLSYSSQSKSLAR